MMAALTAAKTALATIPGVISCKIGFEENISPADFPLIRIIPTRLSPGRPYDKRTCEVRIVFGMPTTNSEGLEDVYDDLFTLEASIIAKIKTLSGRYISTETDEDQLQMYKLMAINAELQGA